MITQCWDAIVIGSGLFGQIIADHLSVEKGLKVCTIDNREDAAGSKPAACLMKPSWFSSLGKEVYEPSLGLLDRLYGVKDLSFYVKGGLHTNVHWVDPKKILRSPTIVARVQRLQRGAQGEWLVHAQGHDGAMLPVLSTKLLIVAAGVWTNEILQTANLGVIGLTGRAGYAHIWKGQHPKPFIYPWAPYRQVVGFNRGEHEIWVGDGTALKVESINSNVRQISLERCAQHAELNPGEVVESVYGIRPYVPKMKPAHLENLEKGIWVATGGAKNGTLAAAHCAHVVGGAI